jgi:hypothetical protein
VFLSNACDVAVQVQAHPHLDWAYRVEQARLVRCERMLYVGLLLADGLWGIDIPAKLRRAARSRFRVTSLVGSLRRSLCEGARERLWFPVQSLLHRLLLAESVRELLQLAEPVFRVNEADRRLVPLPAGLSFLYGAVRPVRLLGKYAGRLAWYAPQRR